MFILKERKQIKVYRQFLLVIRASLNTTMRKLIFLFISVKAVNYTGMSTKTHPLQIFIQEELVLTTTTFSSFW